jgi:hypothetical protein
VIYLNLLFPFLTLVVLFLFFKKQITIIEYVLQFIIPLIVIIICKYISIESQTKDYEIWNSFLINAEYYEYYSTWINKTCSREECTTDSEGNKHCTTIYYDCSYCNENPEYWVAYDNIGNSYSISQIQYNELCKLWNNNNFVDLKRHINTHFGCGKDGDKYITKWNSDFNTIKSITKKHTYKNKVQASRSIFKFKTVDSSDINSYKLFDYPLDDIWNYNPILGDVNIKASKELMKWNSFLGNSKQVHMLICVYKNKPIDAAYYQESLWGGGNKNEFILCIGLKDDKIKWVKVISWTEQDKLKIDIEHDVCKMNYDLVNISNYMAKQVQAKFIRKQFSDFDYLKIEPTTTALIITYTITVLLSIGLAIFFIKNDLM